MLPDATSIAKTVLLVTVLLVSPALPAATGQQADKAGIDAVYDAFSRAYETLDINLLRAQYTPDCTYLPAGNGSTPVQNCETAMAGFESMFSGARADARRLGISFRFVDRSVSGDLAYDVGYYDIVSGPADSANSADAFAERHSYGKFVVVLKRQPDGMWRIHTDGFSPTSREAYEQAPAE